jgi:hypothetical protein
MPEVRNKMVRKSPSSVVDSVFPYNIDDDVVWRLIAHSIFYHMRIVVKLAPSTLIGCYGETTGIASTVIVREITLLRIDIIACFTRCDRGPCKGRMEEMSLKMSSESSRWQDLPPTRPTIVTQHTDRWSQSTCIKV